MMWRNLQSDIGAMFSHYSRGEETQEFVAQLWAKRRTQFISKESERWKRWHAAHRALYNSRRRLYRASRKEIVNEMARVRYHQKYKERIQAKGRAALAAKRAIPLSCQGCGFEYNPTHMKQRYCAPSCARQLRNISRRLVQP